MFYGNLKSNLKRAFQSMKHSHFNKDLTTVAQALSEINVFQKEIKNRTNDELQSLSQLLMIKTGSDTQTDSLLIDAYSLASESIRRILKLSPFDVQILGGILLHHGKVVEMQTGGGKTLTALFPAYLNAISRKGVKVVSITKPLKSVENSNKVGNS